MDLVGRTLGKYRIEAELGRGGMGVVYRAHQTGLERSVALKVISGELLADQSSVARFRREARAIARLNHPGIVQVYDIDEQDGIAYLVMEYIEGQGLDRALHSEPMTIDGSLRVVAEIAEALQFAHDKGVVHRDIKPGNVLMTSYGRPKVLDFGLAYFLDPDHSVTRSGVLVGSPAYMSPEQARGRRVDSRSDVYSLGVVLFRMLCGRVPFVADSSVGVLIMHLQEPIPDPLQLNSELGDDVAEVVRRSLRKDPEARFQTMSDFREAIITAGGISFTGPIPVTASGKIARPRTVSSPVLSTTDESTVRQDAPTALAGAALDPTWIDGDTAPPPARDADAPAPFRAAAPPPRERTAPPPAAEPTARPATSRARPAGLLALVTFALLAGAGGVVLFQRSGSSSAPRDLPAPPPAEIPAVAVLPTQPPPTPVPPSATPLPPTATAPPRVAAPPVARPAASPAPPPATPEPTAPPSPTAAPRSSSLLRYCLSLSPTAFAQGRSKDLPPGFGADAGPVGRLGRPDSGRIQIEFELEPREPMEGQIFVLRGYLANDGVLDVLVSAVEETLSGSATAFRTFRGFPPPSVVRVGKSEAVYSYEGVMRGGTSMIKTVRVTEQQGDSWARSAELRPCEP